MEEIKEALRQAADNIAWAVQKLTDDREKMTEQADAKQMKDITGLMKDLLSVCLALEDDKEKEDGTGVIEIGQAHQS